MREQAAQEPPSGRQKITAGRGHGAAAVAVRERDVDVAARARLVVVHGRQMSVLGRERRGEDVVACKQRAELARLRRRQDPRRHAVLVLQLHVALEGRDVRLLAQDEQVAHLLEVDLPSGTAGKFPEGAEAPLSDLDVQRIGELRSHAARRTARRSAPELRLLEQDHVHAGLREVKGSARSDHPAADDHDGGAVGKRSEPRHPKFTPCASGSSSE